MECARILGELSGHAEPGWQPAVLGTERRSCLEGRARHAPLAGGRRTTVRRLRISGERFQLAILDRGWTVVLTINRWPPPAGAGAAAKGCRTHRGGAGHG